MASKGKGKSGGARVITFVEVLDTTVCLPTIFDKNEKKIIPDSELDNILLNLE